jgi:hypothetical protein
MKRLSSPFFQRAHPLIQEDERDSRGHGDSTFEENWFEARGGVRAFLGSIELFPLEEHKAQDRCRHEVSDHDNEAF